MIIGYCYDEETGFYYVSSRYYDSEVGRFISADTTDVLDVQSDLYDKNLYAYCDNNPIVRKDESGALWIATFVVTAGTGFLTQWAGDIIGNIMRGESGKDIFGMTSSKGEYIAAMATAFIPGSGIAGNLVRNIATEAIVSVERHITGRENSLQSSVTKVFVGTVIDTGVEVVSNNVASNITKRTSKTYSQYAKTAYRRNPNATVDNIRKSAQRSVRWGNRLAKAVDFIINSFRSALSW